MTTAIIRVYRVKQIPSDVAYAAKFRKQTDILGFTTEMLAAYFNRNENRVHCTLIGENDEILEDMSGGQTNKYFDLYDSISAQMIR